MPFFNGTKFYCIVFFLPYFYGELSLNLRLAWFSEKKLNCDIWLS